jgi:hypothetical protein
MSYTDEVEKYVHMIGELDMPQLEKEKIFGLNAMGLFSQAAH